MMLIYTYLLILFLFTYLKIQLHSAMSPNKYCRHCTLGAAQLNYGQPATHCWRRCCGDLSCVCTQEPHNLPMMQGATKPAHLGDLIIAIFDMHDFLTPSLKGNTLNSKTISR